jgi:hypothetical protein
MTGNQQKKIILDTDLCGDCDDVGAMAVLLNLDRLGYAKTLAVTYCLGNPWGSDFIQHTLDWFGRNDIPYGKLTDYSYANYDVHNKRYIQPYFEQFPRKEQYPAPYDSIRLLRRILAENNSTKDITLCAIGGLHNVNLLFTSAPDDISPKSGAELMQENICEVVLMLGNFAHPDQGECNAGYDIPGGQHFLKHCPVPITFAGFETGVHLMTGAPSEHQKPGHPVRESYRLREQGKFVRNSWDPVTVYYAVMGTQGLWRHSAPCTVALNNDASLNIKEGGDHRYLIQIAEDDRIVQILDRLIV